MKIRGFTVPSWAPATAVSAVLAVTLSLGLYSFHASQAISGFEDRSYELEIIQAESAAKDLQMAALTERLNSLEGQVTDLSGRDRDLTLLTREFNLQLGLPEGTELAVIWPELVKTVSWTWGGQKDQGGVDRRSADARAVASSPANVLRGLHRDLDRLEEGAAATGFALSELSAALMGSRTLLAVTPYANPVPVGKVSSLYGYRSNPFGRSLDFHAGLDLAAPSGTPVYAPADGTVLSSDWSKSGYGLMITIDHGFGLTTRYAHLSESLVAPGDKVSRGDQVGKVGSTGRSTGPHLHYETLLGETAVDPLSFMQAKLEFQSEYLEGKATATEPAEDAGGPEPAVAAAPAAGTAAAKPATAAPRPKAKPKARAVRAKRTRRG